ncbi:MAG TPA: ATP-binding protein [Thermoanaerobaculia bacterium]|mgnify:CR=1 FL=1|nr:ATP-binding protein [Thermoanaerobaculia bacterium]HUM30152.1 ATP-binding protein [Thermoanaerobaculia bacterium]HXK68398.1 ATP-binding protein [Thermoanaerobaculia bacterium]
MNMPLGPLLHAITRGHHAIILSGRPLYDLHPYNNRIFTLEAVLREELIHQGFILCTCDLQLSFQCDLTGHDGQTAESVQYTFRQYGLPSSQNEPSVIHSLTPKIDKLLRTSHNGQPEKQPIKLCILIKDAGHWIPRTQDNSCLMEDSLKVLETYKNLGTGISLRKQGHVIILQASPEQLHEEISNVYYAVHVPYPDKEKKHEFFDVLQARYPNAEYESGLSPDQASHISSGTPNLSSETIFRASHSTGTFVTASDLRKQKEADLLACSDGKLYLMDTSRVKNVYLVGSSITTLTRILTRITTGLSMGNPSTPGFVIIPGAPGTGKTDAITTAAVTANISAIRMDSPKSKWVGESEATMTKLLDLLVSQTPVMVLLDEFADSFPTTRNDNHDSGASDAIHAALLTFLSDASLRGRVIFIATSNTIDNIAAAMRSRAEVIPDFFPFKEDYPAILKEQIRRINPELSEQGGRWVTQAAETFFLKGATPRDINMTMTRIQFLYNRLDKNQILRAAEMFQNPTHREAIEKCDLLALNASTSPEYYPWTHAHQLTLPSHLGAVIDQKTKEINYSLLNQRLSELSHVSI